MASKHPVQSAEDFIRSQDAKNTIASNRYAYNTLTKFFKTIAEHREIHEIPPNKLDGLLSRFFMEGRKRNLKNYEPDALSTIHRSIKRYLDTKGYFGEVDILSDKEFATSRKVLAAKRKELRKQGMGQKPHAVRELSASEEDMLYDEGYFSTKNNASLQRGMWWILSMDCGFRGNDESKKLCWGDIILEYDSDSKREKLVWYKERGTKTRNGRENEAPRKIHGTAYATGTNRCPIIYYNAFASHRPQSMMKEESPFFLVNNWGKPSGDSTQVWYLPRPMGVNYIARFLPDAKKRFNLPGNVSNHSVRKTGIGRLLDAKVPEIYVAQHSGMKDPDSLISYKHANRDTQAEMSDILNRNTNAAGDKAIIRSAPSTTAVSNEFAGLELDDWDGQIDVDFHPTIPTAASNTFQALRGLFTNCKIENLHVHLK